MLNLQSVSSQASLTVSTETAPASAAWPELLTSCWLKKKQKTKPFELVKPGISRGSQKYLLLQKKEEFKNKQNNTEILIKTFLTCRSFDVHW